MIGKVSWVSVIYRQIRGRGISVSFVAPLEMPAAGDDASVHAAALGAPHVGDSVQATCVYHQNHGEGS